MRVNYRKAVLSRSAVRAWMKLNVGLSRTTTELAEQAVDFLDLPQEWLDDETHWIWDEAAEIFAGG